ncbi:hypothetical protein KFU94_23580 [Chloroflexi bacterium TSY]|nr:hypothetical protein [Chloroflexi bacterium TSY]
MVPLFPALLVIAALVTASCGPAARPTTVPQVQTLAEAQTNRGAPAPRITPTQLSRLS